LAALSLVLVSIILSCIQPSGQVVSWKVMSGLGSVSTDGGHCIDEHFGAQVCSIGGRSSNLHQCKKISRMSYLLLNYCFISPFLHVSTSLRSTFSLQRFHKLPPCGEIAGKSFLGRWSSHLQHVQKDDHPKVERVYRHCTVIVHGLVLIFPGHWQ